jgi:peptidoglycan/xylan/chitin deacetylase (PgdA/CDA1 family)
MLCSIIPKSYTLTSLLGGNGLRVVLYHHVADAPCELTDRLGVTTRVDDFEWQLDVFARDYDVVDLDAVLSGRLPRRPLLITFDDAYRSILDTAAPMLAARGMSSVFFLVPGLVGGSELMLDNLLCLLANRVGLGTIEAAITGETPRCTSVGQLIARVVADLPYAKRLGLGKSLASRFDVDAAACRERSNLYLCPDDLPRLVDLGIEIGNHTASHVHCRSLDPASADSEITRSKRMLEAWSGTRVRAFSYPYGAERDATDVAEEAIRSSGHEAEFLVHARATARGHGGPLWYRTGIHARDSKRLFVELEVLPRLRAFRHALAR